MRKRKDGTAWANRGETNFPIEQARELYQSGLSLRQVGKKIGWSDRMVAIYCEDITRGRSEALLIRRPAKSTHWRSSRAAARRKMERHLGRKLETWEYVHHKDEDYTNNTMGNLEIMTAHDHNKYHHPKNPIPTHERPQRRAYMQEWNRLNRYIQHRCPYCQIKFRADKYRLKRNPSMCCSHSCAGKLRYRNAASTS